MESVCEVDKSSPCGKCVWLVTTISTSLPSKFPGPGPLAGADGGTTQSIKNSFPCSESKDGHSHLYVPENACFPLKI